MAEKKSGCLGVGCMGMVASLLLGVVVLAAVGSLAGRHVRPRAEPIPVDGFAPDPSPVVSRPAPTPDSDPVAAAVAAVPAIVPTAPTVFDRAAAAQAAYDRTRAAALASLRATIVYKAAAADASRTAAAYAAAKAHGDLQTRMDAGSAANKAKAAVVAMEREAADNDDLVKAAAAELDAANKAVDRENARLTDARAAELQAQRVDPTAPASAPDAAPATSSGGDIEHVDGYWRDGHWVNGYDRQRPGTGNTAGQRRGRR